MKKTLFILFLCTTALGLHAQHVYKNDSLGIRAEFPCPPREEKENHERGEGPEEDYVIICEQKKAAFAIFINKMPVFETGGAFIEEYLLAAEDKIMKGFDGIPGEDFQLKTTENSGEVRFQIRSKELNGNFWLQCRNGYMVEIMYITEAKVRKAAWKRFSESFKTDW